MQKVILVAAMILLICGVGLSYLDKTGGATVTYAAAVFCLIFAFLPEFKRFKGLGVEAELLEKKIEEADVILGHLRSLSAPLAELLFTMVARLGRWDSAVPRQDRYRILGRFEDALRGLGVPDAELSQAKSEWHRYNLIDQARPIVQSVRKRLQEKVAEQRKIIEGFRSPISPEDQPKYAAECERLRAINEAAEGTLELLKLPDMTRCAERIREFVQSCAYLSETDKSEILTSQADLLEDLDHYGRKLEFRRLEIWFASDEK